VFDLEIVWTTDLSYFKNQEGLKINYSQNKMDGVQNIVAGSYFEAFDINNIPNFEKDLDVIDGQIQNDFIAAAFFLLSRAEEYSNASPDQHGRFKSKSSELFKKGLHHWPLIDIWADRLIKLLEKTFNTSIKVLKEYTFKSTIDVDHLYAYKYKPLTIKAGALLRDSIQFKLNRIKDRYKKEDPYDRLDEMLTWHKQRDLIPQFFILCSKRGPFDKSFPPESSIYQQKIKAISEGSELGIHPSYASYHNTEKIKEETDTLGKITDKTIQASRQHFLRLTFPESYRCLIDAGIKEDYSMGFAEDIGFRAGISRSFYWYDLDRDAVTSLRVYPFQIMDVTLKKYLRLKPEEALTESLNLLKRIQEVKGEATIIWHNSSFYESEGWEGYEAVYKSILDYSV